MILRRFARCFLIALPLMACGAGAEPVDAGVEEKLRTTLESPAKNLVVQSVKDSEIPGMYLVQFANGPLVYSTADGKYFILGDLYEVQEEGYVNLAEQRRDGERLEQMAVVDRAEMIIFSPEGETKGYIYAFTDITCGFCRKLHQEVPQLNAAGVEVRYLAYPRGGPGSDAFKQLVTAWCADNRQDALTRLKNGEQVAAKSCAENPVNAQFRLGQEVGVRGTPAIVTDSGQMIPGYKSADELIAILGVE